jgi:hypothetical protein
LNIEAEPSPFYPPRARWWSRLLLPWFRFQRALHLEKIHCPAGFSVGTTFLALLVPGLSFCTLGRKMLGLSILAVYGVAVPVYVVRLGFTEGNFAYGLMLAAHATSVFYLLSHWLGRIEFGARLGLALASLLAVWLALYLPLISYLEHHIAVPLRVRGQVVVMHPHLNPSEIKRGDRIMFDLAEKEIGQAHGGDGAVWVRAGVGWGPVLALPKDRVLFSTNSFSVNGVEQPSLANMPAGGEMVVPTNRWFVWPEFAINSHGNVSEANISALIMQLATVSATQMTGRPYPTWFWRKQKIP